MTKKELIAHCNSLVKKVARKQLTIEDLKKKKGSSNTAALGDCKHCKVYEERYTNAIAEARTEAEKHLGETEDLEDQIKGLKKDIVTLENGKTKLENEAKVEAVRMKAVEDQLAKAEAQSLFYQSRLFPGATPTHGAAHGASVSMAGGGGNRVPSPAGRFASPPE